MKTAVLISGNGSNLQALLDSPAARHIALVLSDKSQAYGLQRAEKAGVPSRVLLPADFAARDDYDRALADLLNELEIELVVLAGWMRILGPQYLDNFRGDTINLHPALPGSYPGLHSIRRAYEDKVDSGCMVHRVTAVVDVGEVLGTRTVPYRTEESLADFEARMHQAEHQLLPEVVGRLVGEPERTRPGP